MDLKFDVECPNCKAKNQIALASMTDGAELKCNSCPAIFKIKGDDGAKAQKATDDLVKLLGSLGKKV